MRAFPFCGIIFRGHVTERDVGKELMQAGRKQSEGEIRTGVWQEGKEGRMRNFWYIFKFQIGVARSSHLILGDAA